MQLLKLLSHFEDHFTHFKSWSAPHHFDMYDHSFIKIEDIVSFEILDQKLGNSNSEFWVK